jgi:hypothetical protein
VCGERGGEKEGGRKRERLLVEADSINSICILVDWIAMALEGKVFLAVTFVEVLPCMQHKCICLQRV